MPEPSIRPLGLNQTKLQAMRELLAEQRHIKVNQVYWNDVLTVFFASIGRKDGIILELRKDILSLQQQITKLGGKVEHKTEIMEEVLLNLSRQAAAPVMMQANPTMVSAPQQAVLTPPPVPPQLPPISPKAPTFIKELNGKFCEGKVLPSEIGMEFNDVKYLENE